MHQCVISNPLTLTAIHSSQFTLLYGAGDGIRTRDPNLGKVVLYH